MYLVAIALDIMDKIDKLRKCGSEKLIKIAEYHDVYDALMIKNHLKAEKIDCHLQGFYHRCLLYFFGPYIDISLMVIPRNKENSKKTINKYYSGLGLISP